MFGVYLWRELVNRRKQTMIIAIGMALAIALVIVVNSVAAGVGVAQAQVLESVYGVGTDVTISQAPTADAADAAGGRAGGNGGDRFDFGANAGASASGSQAVHVSRLVARRGATTMSISTLATANGVKNVASAAGVLSLTNTTFDGTLPNFANRGTAGRSGGAATRPAGGADGAGGSSFTTSSFSVLGLDPGGTAVGPLSAATLSSGRSFTKADTGKDVVVLDKGYAKTDSLAVGDTTTIGGTALKVIGLVGATGSDAETAANAYIPLDVAQALSTETGKISSVYVQAASSSDISQIKTDLQKALPTATVSTQADLASTVSGSLGTAAQLLGNFGTVLSLVVLAAAFVIAILFTIAGVTRRTREFGTLKAIGWSNRRIVGQVAGESIVQGLIGGIVGVAVGLIGVLIVNVMAPSLTGATSKGGSFALAAGRLGGGATTAPGASGAGQAAGHAARHAAGGGFGGGGAGASAASTTHVVLSAPVSVWVILIAVGLAIVGGLLAGAIGGWRASRLRPAEALRSVA